MAFKIIKHAFAMIFNNFGQALRVSIGPYILLILTSALIGVVASSGNTNLIDVLSGAVPPEALSGKVMPLLIGFVAIMILALFIAAWVAVSWHRFILLEEYSGILPTVSGRIIWPYVGVTMRLGLWVTNLGLVIGLIMRLVLISFSSAGETGFYLGGVIIGIVMVAILSFMWFRMGVALPAVAVGKPIKLGEAWDATSKINGTIIGIVLIIAVVWYIAGVATQGLYGIHPAIGVIANLFVQWVNLMIGVSILTMLYGHVIEGRPLID